MKKIKFKTVPSAQCTHFRVLGIPTLYKIGKIKCPDCNQLVEKK